MPQIEPSLRGKSPTLLKKLIPRKNLMTLLCQKMSQISRVLYIVKVVLKWRNSSTSQHALENDDKIFQIRKSAVSQIFQNRLTDVSNLCYWHQEKFAKVMRIDWTLNAIPCFLVGSSNRILVYILQKRFCNNDEKRKERRGGGFKWQKCVQAWLAKTRFFSGKKKNCKQWVM